MAKGQLVTVRLYGGQTAIRRVVAVKRDVIVICTEEEYQEAQRDRREPSGLGFPRQDVMEMPVAPTKKDVRSEAAMGQRSSKAGD